MQAEPELLLWGVPELRAGGSVLVFAPERRFQMLALLALQSGRWVARDQVAALLWPERGLSEARRNLRKVLFKAHELAGVQGLEASDSTLRWSVRTDLQAFEAELGAGRASSAIGRRRGAPLDRIDDPCNAALSGWLAAERARIDQAWHAAALDDLHAQSDPQARIAAARRLLAVDPLDEPALAALLEAERAQGRGNEALDEYRRYASRLAEELGVEPSRALRALVDEGGGVSVMPALHEAPVADPSFIGRKAEIAELCAMLARPECRMVTILGPGGIGKSSLARRAVERIEPGYPGGARWIELQDLSDAPQLLARLAQRLGVEVSDSKDPLAALARRLCASRSLLVLDNAEHLAELPALIDRLLAAAPPLCVLLTSRVRLHGSHEWVLPLHGLAVPDEESRDAEAAGAFDAVRLFAARAEAAQRGFRLADHLGAVIDIAETVAGMPLAIELAASWVRLLPPEEIARELHGSIDLLQRDPAARAQPARPEHRSMQAVLDGAWALLAPRERQALSALSVFHGGFTRSAAQRVAGVPLPLLSALADKSLIAADENGRFGMHPLVAAYAAQALDEDAERAAETRTRHAECFALYLAGLIPHVTGDQRVLVAGVTAEYANCRAAWLWAVEQQRADLVYALVRSLWSFFEIRGRYVEGIALLRPGLNLPPDHPATPRALTRLRHGLSMLHHRKGDQQQALSLARSGIEPGEECGDTEAYVGCLLNAGMCLWFTGRRDEARGYYERGLQVSRKRSDHHCILWSLGNLGNCLGSQGELDAAEAMLGQALAGMRELGDHYATVVNLNNLARLYQDKQQWAAALAHYEEGLSHCVSFGMVSIRQYLASNMARALHLVGRHEEARGHFEAALAGSREVGLLPIEWSADLNLARLDIEARDWSSAAQRLKRVVLSARALDGQPELTSAADIYGDLLAAQGHAAQAAAVWHTVLAQGASDATRQRTIAAKLALNAAPADAPALSLAAVLAQIEAAAHPRAGA